MREPFTLKKGDFLGIPDVFNKRSVVTHIGDLYFDFESDAEI